MFINLINYFFNYLFVLISRQYTGKIFFTWKIIALKNHKK